jgi:hypothetical protein
MTDRPPATRTVWRAVRWPTAALAISLALLVIGLVLDRLPPGRAHEMALVFGGPALTALLPLSLLWLVASLVLYAGRRQQR